MKYILIILLLSAHCINLDAQVSIITTIAGKDTAGYCCDGGPATNAKLYLPESICLDNFGNLYISDGFNCRIRKIVLSTGIISTIAGNGISGFSGDSIPAINSQLCIPVGICTDTSGNIYIADASNHRIRKVTILTGIITTIAGTGIAGSVGDGGLAINARLNLPCGLCFDLASNLYIADYSNNKIRKIDMQSGIITTFAGTGTMGYAGDGSPATGAKLDAPLQVACNSSGDLFICDQWNHAIRKVSASTGTITTITGNGTPGYSGDGLNAAGAILNQPSGIFVDKYNNIFIAEHENAVVRKIDGATNIITTIAGVGVKGFSGDGGPPTSAHLWCTEVRVDTNGTIYIADNDNNRVRMIYNPTLSVKPAEGVQMISIYPNPATNELTIEGAQNTAMVICDVVGKVVMERKLIGAKETIDISALNNGVYVVQVYDAMHNTRSMAKLVVAR